MPGAVVGPVVGQVTVETGHSDVLSSPGDGDAQQIAKDAYREIRIRFSDETQRAWKRLFAADPNNTEALNAFVAEAGMREFGKAGAQLNVDQLADARAFFREHNGGVGDLHFIKRVENSLYERVLGTLARTTGGAIAAGYLHETTGFLTDHYDGGRAARLISAEHPDAFAAGVVFSYVAGGVEALGLKGGGKVLGREAAERGVVNLTERGTLTNLFPNDAVLLQSRARTLVQDDAGRYWLQSGNGSRITPSGSYDFVTMPDGAIRVARTNPSAEFSTHLGLSSADEVSYAGTIRFANRNTATRGSIRSWSNASGHYQPPAWLSGNSNLPSDLFLPY